MLTSQVMKIKIERKSQGIKVDAFELENQTIVAEPHYCNREVWCTIQFGDNPADCIRTPYEGTLEISAI